MDAKEARMLTEKWRLQVAKDSLELLERQILAAVKLGRYRLDPSEVSIPSFAIDYVYDNLIRKGFYVKIQEWNTKPVSLYVSWEE